MRSLLVALVAAHINAQCPSPYQGTSIDACFLISDFPRLFAVPAALRVERRLAGHD